MKKILCLILFTLVYFNVHAATPTPTATPVEFVMFKCDIVNKDNAFTKTERDNRQTISQKPAKRPSASVYLSNIPHYAVFEYSDTEAFVFVIIPQGLQKDLLKSEYGLKGLTKDEETKYALTIQQMKNEADYINGVKPRPTEVIPQ